MTLSEAGKRRAAAEHERSVAASALMDAVRKAAKDGLTPTQIAEEAGVTRQWVHRILRKAK